MTVKMRTSVYFLLELKLVICFNFFFACSFPESLLLFQCFPTLQFQDFPGLENEIIKFKDFPGFPRPLRRIQYSFLLLRKKDPYET